MERPRGNQRVMVALDGITNIEQMGKMVLHLSSIIGGCFKVGLELIMKFGVPEASSIVTKNGGRLFIDGKFCDIPNTVGLASQAAAALGAIFFNVHASTGREAIKAAVANRGQSKVLVVTVLTSLDDAECVSIFGQKSQEKVLQFALTSKEVGVDGLICSPKEVALLRSRPELNDLLLVTPGVRPEWAAAGDQKRIMTPGEAILAGADYLVIGRPITKPPENKFSSPVEAANAIVEEIQKAEKEMGLDGQKEV